MAEVGGVSMGYYRHKPWQQSGAGPLQSRAVGDLADTRKPLRVSVPAQDIGGGPAESPAKGPANPPSKRPRSRAGPASPVCRVSASDPANLQAQVPVFSQGSASGSRWPPSTSTSTLSTMSKTTLLVPSHTNVNVQVHHHQAQARAKFYSSNSLHTSSPSTTTTTTTSSSSTSLHPSFVQTSAFASYSLPSLIIDDSAITSINSSSHRIPLVNCARPVTASPTSLSIPSLSVNQLPLGTDSNYGTKGDSHNGDGDCVSGRGRPRKEAKRSVMQRVSAFLPSWDKRSSTRSGFFGWSSNRSSTASISAGSTLSKINTGVANGNGRVHREAFWPVTLDGECDKAARILKSFSTDGFLAPLEEEIPPSIDEPTSPRHVTKKIPRRIIQNAAGIAIFTCMRSGLWMTGSGGSGILIARKSDGTWSPPSGIMLHTPTLSFIIGVDVYDCVLVINNLAALESITKSHVTLGEDVGLTSGPLVSLDSDESDIKWKDLGNTVLTYMKARGQAQDVNLNGCILTERVNENERFYSSGITQIDILAGNVSRNVEETKPLFEVIKMAEGRTDYDSSIIKKVAIEPAPSDAVIATPKSSVPASPQAFGVPRAEDPDPFGVLALEMAGLEIREAGSRLRPESSQFDFNPSPMSPAFSKFNRQSTDTFMSKSNRGSYMSSRTVKSQMTDAGTQTKSVNTAATTPSPSQSDDGRDRMRSSQIPEEMEEAEEVDYTKVDMSPLRHISGTYSARSVASGRDADAVEHDMLRVDEPAKDDIDGHSKASSIYDKTDEDEQGNQAVEDESEDSEDDEDEEDEEEPVVFEVAAVQPARTQAVASRMIHAKGNVVTIAKRTPPPLPSRSPARISRSSKSEIGDVSSLRSPLRQTFSEGDLKEEDNEMERNKSGTAEQTASTSGDDKSESSDTEFFPTDETKAGAATPGERNEDKESINSTDKSDESTTIPHQEQLGFADSVAKKHTSSVYTGTTDDRWSDDGTSLTTPTSDRPYSVVDDVTEEKTPKQPVKEHEVKEEDKKVETKDATRQTISVA